jgi:hypothetical protein
MVGRHLEILFNKGVISKKLYLETRKFINVRNDVMHKRWDGTIKQFRKICDFGICLNNFYCSLAHDFYEFDDVKKGSKIIDYNICYDVLANKNGKIVTVKHKRNAKLFNILEKIIEQCKKSP